VTDRLFGVETEYAVTGLNARGTSLDRAPVVDALLKQARSTLPHLPDEFSHGMFLQNGARFYVDQGYHPELTTPECSNPWDVVRYILAGERILTDLAAPQAGRRSVAQVLFYRCNVDYAGARSTWGCHESYMHRVDPGDLPAHIIPHLVSRLIYTGAGGFNNLSPGIEFTLSPRAAHLSAEVSADSTHSRAIFHTKDEPLCAGGFHRLHLICGESLCSHLATFLKVGTTALVVALIEAGAQPAAAVGLRAPVVAMHAFAADPTCTAAVETQRLTALRAIDIQRHYLELAYAHRQHVAMPPWTEACCTLWRSVLDRLENAPASVSTMLDWSIKLPLYKDRVRRRGLAWELLPVWNAVARRLSAAQARTEQRHQPLKMEMIRTAYGPVADEVAALTPVLRDHGMSWNLFRPFLELRQELFEIDIRFGQLGDAGIFARLDASGTLAHRVAGVDNIQSAVAKPPSVPRAQRRGQLVRELTGKGDRYHCDWEGIWDCEVERMIDLRDPFAATTDWQSWPTEEELLNPRSLRGRLHQHLTFVRDLRRGRRRSAST
jgi:hypothetical protein